MTLTRSLKRQPDVPAALATAAVNKKDWIAVGRMDGSWKTYRLPDEEFAASAPPRRNNPASVPRRATADVAKASEQEPNDAPQQAQAINLPAEVTGSINPQDGQSQDFDLYRFEAKKGHAWILEINAARSGAPLDSMVEILDAEGTPVTRVLLQAVRDSYFTFRGKDSKGVGDFRLHHWQEMSLNQLLYANGEVTKLYHYPRGPDSGFNVYPNFGSRRGFYDTTPLAHALGEPCYIVEPRDPDAVIVPNGLPVFTIPFENDDDSRQRYGADSQLTFTAPQDGTYLARVRDARGFGGPAFKYTLRIRAPKPDFQIKVNGANPSVPAGAGRKFGVEAARIDGLDGEIQINVSGLPPGFSVAGPIVVEPGQRRAWASIIAAADAPQPTAENAKGAKLTATALVHGKTVTHEVSLGEIKLSAKPKLTVAIHPAGDAKTDDGTPVLEISPGETVKAKLIVQRQGHKGVSGFG
ncbi:MAG: hypothetical protein N2C14_31310, partial [Planctomycetales bacterium]